MAKKKDNTILILGIIAIVVFIYAGQADWFQSYNISNYSPANPDKVIILENPPTTSEVCSLSINPLSIFIGDTVTGIIQDGTNRLCEVYATDGSGWRLIYTGTTDNTGRLSSTQTIDFVGTFKFRAICGSCSTNEVILIVNLPEEEYEGCYDSDLSLATIEDRIQFVGYCQDIDGVKLDECSWTGAVSEYYCEPTMSPPMEQTCGFTSFNCVGMLGEGAYCEGGECILPDSVPDEPIYTDSDGDGFSDEEELNYGTDPNNPDSYPNGPAEQTADYCNALGFGWSKYMPGSSPSGCLGEAYNVCFPIFGLQYQDSTYSDPSCCFKCA